MYVSFAQDEKIIICRSFFLFVEIIEKEKETKTERLRKSSDTFMGWYNSFKRISHKYWWMGHVIVLNNLIYNRYVKTTFIIPMIYYINPYSLITVTKLTYTIAFRIITCIVKLDYYFSQF